MRSASIDESAIYISTFLTENRDLSKTGKISTQKGHFDLWCVCAFFLVWHRTCVLHKKIYVITNGIGYYLNDFMHLRRFFTKNARSAYINTEYSRQRQPLQTLYHAQHICAYTYMCPSNMMVLLQTRLICLSSVRLTSQTPPMICSTNRLILLRFTWVAMFVKYYNVKKIN